MISILTGLHNSRTLWRAVIAVAALIAGSCDKVPLLAPTASTITLASNSATVQANGVAEIRATVLEVSGTPVHNGTTVSFTTTIGTLSPVEARTVNGVATVQFVGNGQSGEAEIRAASGAAKPDTTVPLKLKVGGFAATKVTLNANPTNISAAGGTSVITANVSDVSGNALAGVSVSFSTTTGSLSSTSALTNQSGNALTTLTTTRDATVTASLAALTATVDVKTTPLPVVSISASDNPRAGGVTTFTIGAAPAAAGPPLQSVIVNYGDGTTSDLGAVSGTAIRAQHVYDEDGTYTASVTARDTFGSSATAATVLVVQAPLNVSIAVTTVTPAGLATFTATVSPPGTPISSFAWSFGDGTGSTTTTPQTSHAYIRGTYTVTVTATSTNGQTASASTQVIIP
jgi:PKD domain/Bacterial Ig-like domain (group 1)